MTKSNSKKSTTDFSKPKIKPKIKPKLNTNTNTSVNTRTNENTSTSANTNLSSSQNVTQNVNSMAALKRLKEGNLRFAKNLTVHKELTNHEKRQSLVAAQNPFAIILSCSDSRAPSEILFDQGLGDLFVIRVAGNIVAPSIIGSVEFAAATYGTQLVVVMGHSRCGAVTVTLNSLRDGSVSASENIHDIVERISPSVETVLSMDQKSKVKSDPERILQECIRANVRSSVQQLSHGSKILEVLIQSGNLKIIGAEYSLETGLVEFFEK